MINISQDVVWPGAIAVQSCRGTVSHGISPSVFVLVTYPQPHPPAAFGNLTFSDGIRQVTFRDCKADAIQGHAGPDGQTWTITILDRRWKWRFGTIGGRYNQLDPRGKLIPWTIRSPEELCRLCLDTAGERGYMLVVPDGLRRADGANLDRFLRAGEAFPQSLMNPPVVWDVVPPMVALARFAEQIGCRVIFQPIANRVLVAPLGKGEPLPDGPLEMSAPAIDDPETPSAVAIAGAPVRIQARFRLEAVGREWDGEYLPINLLSYAPLAAGQNQISTFTFTGSNDPTSLAVDFTFLSGQPAEKTVSILAPGATVAAKLQELRDKINAHTVAQQFVVASCTATVLTLTGKNGLAFEAVGDAIGLTAGDTWIGALTQLAIGGNGKSWRTCTPPEFGAVRATDQLSRQEAIALARQHIWRTYRIRAVRPDNPDKPLVWPFFGEIKRRQQIILQATKVDQVRPLPRDKNGVDKGAIPLDVGRNPAFAAVMGGIMPDFYNGYSRDQPATITGSIASQIGSVTWNLATGNTTSTDKVYVSFTIDPVEQLVIFAEPVYRTNRVAGSDMCVDEPVLTLETAVLLMDPNGSDVSRWKEERLTLGGAGGIRWENRDDVQVNLIFDYDDLHRIQDHRFEGLEDAKPRAKFYLNMMASQYQATGGDTRQYIGIYPIDPDGFIQQVTWSVGGSGATTVASAGSEHDAFIPDYPARRRAENLPPDKMAQAANQLEQKFADAILPKIGDEKKP